MASSLNRQFRKESEEHPDFAPKQIWAIVRDHYKANGDEANAKAAGDKMTSLADGAPAKFAELNRVEIFMQGTHLGEDYSESDIKEIADNTNALLEMGKHEPPAKLGHSEDQKVAQEAGLPAVGWVERVYAEGGTLLADFKQVPTLVADAIRKGLYKHVSSEIYWPKATAQYFGEFGITGKVLRAVAFLGADVPVVKGLAPLMLHESIQGGYKVAVFECRDNHIMAHAEPDGDEKDKNKKLMVPANRHPFGALVKMAGSDKAHMVHSVHPDGSYDVGELHDPMAKPTKQVPHDNLTLLSEQEAQGALAKMSEQLKLGVGGQPKTKEEVMPENQAVKLAEDKAAEAVKLAESEKAKRIEMENQRRDERIAAFAEKHKEFITPAVKPAFEAVAKTEAASVKLAEKDVPFLDAVMAFAEQLIAAKRVVLGELAPEGKSTEEAQAAAVKMAEESFKDTTEVKMGGRDVLGASLAVKARAYSETNKVSYRDALIAVSALEKVK